MESVQTMTDVVRRVRRMFARRSPLMGIRTSDYRESNILINSMCRFDIWQLTVRLRAQLCLLQPFKTVKHLGIEH